MFKRTRIDQFLYNCDQIKTANAYEINYMILLIVKGISTFMFSSRFLIKYDHINGTTIKC